MVRKLLQPFYTAYAVITFVIGLLINFPFFLLISIGNNIAKKDTLHRYPLLGQGLVMGCWYAA